VSEIVFRELGLRPFRQVWSDMQRFTDGRTADTGDEIWFVEHPSVFTLGLNSDPAHLLSPADIEIVQTDRGGQVTYHGPGQLVCYALLDIKRRGLNVRTLVQALESAVIDTVAIYSIRACSRRTAPGVYVDNRKLAAIGLRVRRGCSYHGIAINVNMDLEPFLRIRPCGIDDLEVTQLADLCAIDDMRRFRQDLEPHLLARLRVEEGP